MTETYFTEDMDATLEEVAKSVGGKLTIDRPGHPEGLISFQERRIDWATGSIFKAIIIQPEFTRRGVNLKKWNFIALAWIDEFEIHRPQKMEHLLEKVKFSRVVDSFEKLLSDAVEKLSTVEEKDLC